MAINQQKQPSKVLKCRRAKGARVLARRMSDEHEHT